MTQISSSPGVPQSLPTVTASSATPIMAGTTAISTQSNVYPTVLIEQGVVVPFNSYTPIQLPTNTGFPI